MSNLIYFLGFRNIIFFISAGFSVLLVLLVLDIVTVDDVVVILGLCGDYLADSDNVIPEELREELHDCSTRDVLNNIVDNLRGAASSILEAVYGLSDKLLDWSGGD